jgi:RNA 2',3'-cyclic 3'-phosphodiesterase
MPVIRDLGARVRTRHTAGVRLFVALRPPDDVLDAVARLRRRERAGVRWTTRPQWHVTLRFLGEVAEPAPVVAALDEALLESTTAVVGPRVSALGRGVVVVPVAGLEPLAGAVVTATGVFGTPPPDRPFRGHLTLARSRHGSVRDLVGEEFVAQFPVDEIALVRSHLGRDGARYEDLHVRRLG